MSIPQKQQVREDLIRCLNRAERDHDVIGFKWFRDSFLAQAGFAWGADVAARQSGITLAIQDGLIRADKRTHPQEMLFGATQIRLNRTDERVRVILHGDPPAAGPLRPPLAPPAP